MSTLAHTVADSRTMLRRSLLHAVRYPVITYLVLTPLIFLLLFVYVFGDTLGAGIGGEGTDAYLQYVVPGVLLLTIAGGVTGPALSVSKDLTEGIIARFRTMDISRSAVLTGHVLGNLVQVLLATAIVTAVALLMGFRAPASVLDVLAAAALLAAIGFVLCWLGAAFGVFAKGVESASNLPMPLMILPFLGSGFVPTESMPGWLQWFAEHQPFTPFIETLRALLFDTELGSNGWLSLVWILVLGLIGWLWARFLYERKTVR
ncbi:ABC transporter permease [Solirubrobacter phytolaccae]|uniref:Transport permease protein n=1 Tax=Solirubrobacter phytolaccae TaxID=1404360 RepID=A0A9X3N7Q2_9ACTN|nr:ABC transporter permease [Solirubrobacter phytolaccae]MDA0179797.1 ABC transporter permease [Solirubrobacter phytolaccae]